jgi:hypothetical protein
MEYTANSNTTSPRFRASDLQSSSPMEFQTRGSDVGYFLTSSSYADYPDEVPNGRKLIILQTEKLACRAGLYTQDGFANMYPDWGNSWWCQGLWSAGGGPYRPGACPTAIQADGWFHDSTAWHGTATHPTGDSPDITASGTFPNNYDWDYLEFRNYKLNFGFTDYFEPHPYSMQTSVPNSGYAPFWNNFNARYLFDFSGMGHALNTESPYGYFDDNEGNVGELAGKGASNRYYSTIVAGTDVSTLNFVCLDLTNHLYVGANIMILEVDA